MDRRTTIQWVLSASVAWPLRQARGAAAASAPKTAPAPPPRGYGSDPKLLPTYRPGDLWPLTLSPAQRRLAAVLADLIIPADAHSASASQAGVVDFIDEWISAPYPASLRDRPMVLDGFAWLDGETARRGGRTFALLPAAAQQQLCDDICDATRATPERRGAARFFALYRNLTAGGFYSTPLGRRDLGYIGNVPLARFDGPPAELLRKLNLP